MAVLDPPRPQEIALPEWEPEHEPPAECCHVLKGAWSLCGQPPPVWGVIASDAASDRYTSGAGRVCRDCGHSRCSRCLEVLNA